MNTMMRTLWTASISTLALVASVGVAQTADPAPAGEPKQVAPENHDGHNHATTNPASSNGVQPTTVRPVPTQVPGQRTPEGVNGPSAQSALLFKETTKSTGEILDTGPADLIYEFKNTGSETLEIQLIKPSCGCTVPEMEKKSYEPGETGTMKVTFDPSGKKGAISRNITIYTNSSSKPVHTLIVQSFVKPVVITKPRILAFDMTQKGQSQTKDISIYGRFEDFKVTRATTTDPDVFAVEVVDGGQVEFEGETMWLQTLRVTILESAKPDSHRTEISVRTNEEHKPLFSLAVVGRVIGDLQLSPVRMTMGRLVVGDEFEREVTLRSKSGDAFEIKSVNSVNVVLDAEYTATPVDPEKRNEWTIKVAGTVIHPAQRFNAQMTVVTDVADEETLTVQMYGQLQPKVP